MHTEITAHIQLDGTLEWPSEPLSTNDFQFVMAIRDGHVSVERDPDASYIKSGPMLRALYRATAMAQSPMNRLINYPTELAGQWIEASNEVLATLSCMITMGAQVPTSGQIQRYSIEMGGGTELYISMMEMFVDSMAFAELNAMD